MNGIQANNRRVIRRFCQEVQPTDRKMFTIQRTNNRDRIIGHCLQPYCKLSEGTAKKCQHPNAGWNTYLGQNLQTPNAEIKSLRFMQNITNEATITAIQAIGPPTTHLGKKNCLNCERSYTLRREVCPALCNACAMTNYWAMVCLSSTTKQRRRSWNQGYINQSSKQKARHERDLYENRKPIQIDTMHRIRRTAREPDIQ